MKSKKSFWLRHDLEQLITLGFLSKVPQRQIAIGYLSYVIIGTLLLMLPFSQRIDTSIIDNLFTVTSAVSTTGLGTVVLADQYTIFGQIVVLLMVQIGGLGYMTMSSFVIYRMTHHFMRIKNGVLRAEFSMPEGVSMSSLVSSIIAFTFTLETIGAIILSFMFAAKGADSPIWAGVFHSVSSFCTAGFSTFATGLETFKADWGINLVIASLSYAGAMGFIVMLDLWKKVRNWRHRITFTTKIIVLITGVITVLGTTQIYFLEPTLDVYPASEKLLISFFQTMSAMTTVGFNTVPLGGFVTASLMILVFVMYIGASPSGTGGGLKSTTASAIYAFLISKLSLNRDTVLMGHRLPSYRVESALTTFIFYTSILFLGTYILTITESFGLDALLFEATSALGTVGLSTGITATLSIGGKLVLIAMMYIGRIGVITFGNAMIVRMETTERKAEHRSEDIAV